MKLGIVGLPHAGKTTVFNALTHAGALATAYAFSSAEANHGVVAVPDERLDRLNEVLQTPREVHATIEVVDIPGLAGGGGEHGQGLGSRFLSDIREVDAVAHVVRAFANPEVAFPRATIDPVADVLARMRLPFVFTTGYGRAGVPPGHTGRGCVEKPFRLDDLARVLSAELRGRSFTG